MPSNENGPQLLVLYPIDLGADTWRENGVMRLLIMCDADIVLKLHPIETMKAYKQVWFIRRMRIF